MDLTGRISASSSDITFSRLNTGDILSAKIIARNSSTDVTLEIGGQRIRANFPEGVPSGNSLTLILKEKTSGYYHFGVYRQNISSAFSEAFGINGGNPLFSAPYSSIQQLAQYVSSGAISPFYVFSILSGKKPNHSACREIAKLLNVLLNAGFPSKSLAPLAGAVNTRTLTALKNRTGFPDFSHSVTDNIFDIDDIISDIESIESEKHRKRLISLFLQLTQENSEDALLIRNADEFIPVKLLSNNAESILLSVEFSAIGEIDILAVKTSTGISASIICDCGEDILSDLKKIAVAFPFKNCKIDTKIVNRQLFKDKLIEIISDIRTNSLVNIKV